MTQMMDILLCAIVAVLFIMSVILLFGKGGFLIAGYNTASKEEKAKYDEPKLCRTMGAGLLSISIASGISVYFYFLNYPPKYYIFTSAVIVISVVVMLVLGNTAYCKKQ